MYHPISLSWQPREVGILRRHFADNKTEAQGRLRHVPKKRSDLGSPEWRLGENGQALSGPQGTV